MEGIVAIPTTPFSEGRVDDDAYRIILDRILDAGVTTLTPNGNTVEFYALTAEERRAVMEACGEHTRARRQRRQRQHRQGGPRPARCHRERRAPAELARVRPAAERVRAILDDWARDYDLETGSAR
ncbi:hypothetical protein GCM10010922_16420 [Microbacterium sorbitolivorans]|uniref:dihydrodipicolinate synthase family protein n=1 Tax=Microbacterium sorbitolivorans TaxID=1867410 RepID=UPI001651900F|nr:hypothetical protein [Microbacterium sorbitolivorans]GGF41615.1 hypothetical protein GCM10010922_16420 [Microbacterium sorbitolivorans]